MKRLLIIPLIILFIAGVSWASIPHRPATPEDGQCVGPQRPLQAKGEPAGGGYFEEDPQGHIISDPPDSENVFIVDVDGIDVAYAGWDFGQGFFSQDFLVWFWLQVDEVENGAKVYVAVFSASLDEAEDLEAADDGQGLILTATSDTTYTISIREMEIDATQTSIDLEVGSMYLIVFYRLWDLQQLHLYVEGKWTLDHKQLNGINQSVYQYLYFVNSYTDGSALTFSADLMDWWLITDLDFFF